MVQITNLLLTNFLATGIRYIANTILNAGFLQFDNQFSDKLRATWGVRVEDYDQVIGSVKQSDPRHLHTQNYRLSSGF